MAVSDAQSMQVGTVSRSGRRRRRILKEFAGGGVYRFD